MSGNPSEARHLMRFFKTAPGQYGEGDKFLGVKVPTTRTIIKEFRNSVTLSDIEQLTSSQWHEIRLAGFLLLIEIYSTAAKRSDSEAKNIVDYYISILQRGNNWDLVDLVAPKILGHRLLHHPEERQILYCLADMDGHMWHQRTAIVSCWTLIRDHQYDDAICLSERLLRHHHDLIHKACGWMLREVGKRGGTDILLSFLETHAPQMPRTMLRYSIEKLSSDERKHFMSMK